MNNKQKTIATVKSNLKRTLLERVLETSVEAVLEHLDRTGFFDDVKKPNVVSSQRPNVVSSQRPNVVSSQRKQIKGKKLTPQDALDIFKEDRMSARDIADIYGIDPVTVYHIKNGYTWWRTTGVKQRKYG